MGNLLKSAPMVHSAFCCACGYGQKPGKPIKQNDGTVTRWEPQYDGVTVVMHAQGEDPVCPQCRDKHVV